jgi:accessory gene regulator protein AgrB
MQQPNSNKANIIIVAVTSTQVNIGRNAGGMHAKRMLGIYIYSILAVLAVSNNCPPF